MAPGLPGHPPSAGLGASAAGSLCASSVALTPGWSHSLVLSSGKLRQEGAAGMWTGGVWGEGAHVTRGGGA